ncbi:hypothetical protein HYC85_011936 [Camellia sinensis]|uniref:Uncharacterized protein n=1 Tax=Camellia sinensis TaxID=4442 RepID=A0A7J7HAI0_CAMSI|nr:hypothetical protein HYC85_011936 [Camellia sinensis]
MKHKRRNECIQGLQSMCPYCMEPQLVHNLGEGHSGNKETSQANIRGVVPSQIGMLQQVKRLVVIETEELYKARKQKDANHQALRPPFVVSHLLAAASDSSQ